MYLLRLSHARLSVEIVPGVGGGLAGFDWLGRGVPIPLMRARMPPLDLADGSPDPNRLACYPLLPWSNRIAGGGFTVDGRFVALHPNRPGEPFPIHGSGWQRPWHVEESSRTHALLSLEEHVAEGYAYRARLRYALDADALLVDVAVTHLAQHPMPYGVGLHPFFLRHGEVALHAPASKVWINDGRTPIPVDRIEVPHAWDFRQSRVLPDEGVNHAFQPWSGMAQIAWPQLGLRLELEANVDTFVLYTPVDEEFFCFEPVDHPINAVHLPGGPQANGMTLLTQGATLARRFVFRVIDEDDAR
ncbi:aldose 1-epimerase [Dyella sp.]|uniref:aldose 1-epimerase n=1 Tax=Dyella sp. TaxID=1869338 RepID=UPI002ED55420